MFRYLDLALYTNVLKIDLKTCYGFNIVRREATSGIESWKEAISHFFHEKRERLDFFSQKFVGRSRKVKTNLRVFSM